MSAKLVMPAKKSPPATDPLHYRVEIASLQAHLFSVTLTIARPAPLQVVSLPVWIPGSYLVREFSRNLLNLQARQGRQTPALEQTTKNTWQVSADPARPLVLSYQVYALDASVRTAWLDASRGFFNGTSLCLRVHGQEDQAHALKVPPSKSTPGWQLATSLAAQQVDDAGFGSYQAANYDELVDCPVELGRFWQGRFKACGVPHRFVVAGAAPSFDGARLLADAQKICETEIRFWHGNKKPPHKHYLFMLSVADDNYGGLEHRHCTALICGRRDLPRIGDSKQSEGYTTLLGLISHEYFHTWNVKRLRPAEFSRYQYDAEQYTRLLWFFEGFTSYYDDLLLRRAGLLDNAAYLKLLNKTINQLMQTPGRLVQSVASASLDAWIKYYRPDENTPNATVSYYGKGALVALCFDLTLRLEGRTTLDAVMRALWARTQAGPMAEADFAAVLADLGGRSFAAEIAAWVHSTDELPLQTLLQQHGVAVHNEPAQLAQRLGLRVVEAGGSIQVKTVLRGGVAEQAGLAAGDEWLAIELPAGPHPTKGRAKAQSAAAHGWRLNKLDDLLLYAGTAPQVTALVARDKRLLRLTLSLPTAQQVSTWRLAAQDATLIDAWLAAPLAPAG